MRGELGIRLIYKPQQIIGPPSPKEFRDAGYTVNAIKYPMSTKGFLKLCAFNGVDPNKVPRAWLYAPNQYMLEYMEGLRKI